MRPRQHHLTDVYTETECGEILGGKCQGCGRGREAIPGTYVKVGPRAVGQARPRHMKRGEMTREEYIAWKALYLNISREEAERSLDS